MALSSRSRNHRSTRLSHELEVGVKCRWKRGCLASQALTLGCLWVRVVIEDHVHCQALGDLAVDLFQERQELYGGGAAGTGR